MLPSEDLSPAFMGYEKETLAPLVVSEPIIWDILEQFALAKIEDEQQRDAFLLCEIDTEEWRTRRAVIIEAIQAVCAEENPNGGYGFLTMPNTALLRALADYTTDCIRDYMLEF
jgi:hypothetical protein